MSEVTKYHRDFMIFNLEDTGFGDTQEPSGYVKIEVKEGRGKLSVSVQNLKEDKKRLLYKVYAIKCTDSEISYVYIDDILVNKGRGELQVLLDENSFRGLSKAIDEFNIIAVVCECRTGDKVNYFCPLVGTRGRKLEWKKRFLEKLNEKRTVFEKPKENITENNHEDIKIEDKKELSANNIRESETADINFNTVIKNDEDSKKECLIDEDKLNCIVKNDNKHYSPCAGCYLNNRNKKTEKNEIGIVESFIEGMNKYFLQDNPFNTKRKDYRWWRVSNTVYLNNILYQSNINTSLLFNPRVLMAHYKYRHLLIGLYSDKVRSKEYIVCCIPALHGIDEKPFGEVCRWVQLENGRPRYGIFGYWLVFIDPISGRIIGQS